MGDIELDPIYLWREARDRGVRRSQICADGARISRGLYLSAAAERTLVTRCRAWTRLLPGDAAFGLETAARLLSVPVPGAPANVQVVLRPRPVLPQRRGLTVHVRDLQPEDVIDLDDLRVTSPAQLFLDLAARVPPAELLAIGDALARTGRLDRDALTRRLERAHRVRGIVTAPQVAPLVRAQAASRPESLIRYWLLASDLPEPGIQVPVLDRWGRAVAHADLGYPQWKVALEYEGRQHAERGQFGRDVERYSLMAADGWLVLRFAGRHLGAPTVIVDRTRRALCSRGWRS